MDLNFWHPLRGTNVTEQRRICVSCPVRIECLHFALSGGAQDGFGIWAGTTGRQRRRNDAGAAGAAGMRQLLEELG
jgi:WhiB family redox-sensing transcriptional regulator